MTRIQATEQACEIVSLAWASLGCPGASDGFCLKCRRKQRQFRMWPSDYRNDAAGLDYVRKAVLQQLRRDGHKVAEGFNKRTGRPWPAHTARVRAGVKTASLMGRTPANV